MTQCGYGKSLQEPVRADVPCEIYEGASRLGGRIFTNPVFNNHDMSCELGGELIDTGHEDIIDIRSKDELNGAESGNSAAAQIIRERANTAAFAKK